MNYVALAAELANDPASLGYAPLVADNNDEALAAMLNEKRYTAPVSRLVNARTMMAELGAIAAATILDKMEAAASINPAIKWAMFYLKSDGLDVGHPQTQGQLDALAAAGVLTPAEAEATKALANAQISRAEQLFGVNTTVTAGDVSIALRGN